MSNKEELFLFCNNVKMLRLKHKMGKKEMAQIMGISRHSLSQIELACIPPHLSLSPIFALAAHFKMKPYELFLPLKNE